MQKAIQVRMRETRGIEGSEFEQRLITTLKWSKGRLPVGEIDQRCPGICFMHGFMNLLAALIAGNQVGQGRAQIAHGGMALASEMRQQEEIFQARDDSGSTQRL